MCDDIDQSNRTQQIKTLLAFELFTQKKYCESMKLFTEISTGFHAGLGL